MRFAVLGALGQLGRDLCPRLSGEVIPLGRADVDLVKPGAVRQFFEQLRPDVVVNCAAYNFVDKAESEPEVAFAVNTWAVRELALVCRDLKCLLIHYSTDHVFGLDAARSTPWQETDAPGPVSVYGLSKLSGEYVIRSICPRHLILRTCGLYGHHGSGGKGGNFVETMLKVARQGKPLRVVGDQVCTPTSTVDLVGLTLGLLKSGAEGLFHVTNDGSCTWYEFAKAIFELARIDAKLTAITSAEFGAAARRPPYSVLSTAQLRSLGCAPRPWREALAEYLCP
jgi:dTDP-4-dehydrorhamnose reductase